MKIVIWCVLFLICFGGSVIVTESARSQEVGLQALKSYEGVWDSEFSIGSQGEADTTKRFSGVVTGKWVVGDKFLEQTGVYELAESSPPMIIRTMMSFDEKQKRYQYDYFDSSGGIRRSFGQWDPAAKKMTSKLIDAESENVTTIVADFSKPGVEKWVIETSNSAGAILTKIVGTNTLRK
jgi:hypothetical protein